MAGPILTPNPLLFANDKLSLIAEPQEAGVKGPAYKFERDEVSATELICGQMN